MIELWSIEIGCVWVRLRLMSNGLVGMGKGLKGVLILLI